MLKTTRDMMLPTAITGSYPRPLWFDRSLDGRSFKAALGDSLRNRSTGASSDTSARCALTRKPCGNPAASHTSPNSPDALHHPFDSLH
jgi:hypothetical protein